MARRVHLEKRRESIVLARKVVTIPVNGLVSMLRQPSPEGSQPIDPTPEQIRQRSEEIRNRWSDRVAERRRIGSGPHWRPPLILTIEVVHQLNQQQRKQQSR